MSKKTIFDRIVSPYALVRLIGKDFHELIELRRTYLSERSREVYSQGYFVSPIYVKLSGLIKLEDEFDQRILYERLFAQNFEFGVEYSHMGYQYMLQNYFGVNGHFVKKWIELFIEENPDKVAEWGLQAWIKKDDSGAKIDTPDEESES